MSEILAVMVIDEDTQRPLYTHFMDKALQKNPRVIPQKLQAREIVMIHELGVNLNLVFSLLVREDAPRHREMLKEFRERVEKTYLQGMKEGSGNWADYVILEGMVKSIFIDQEE
ncbi:MAG: hypothetical protein ACFFEF_14030 [Candidatus Thorarchaeota archaeon]